MISSKSRWFKSYESDTHLSMHLKSKLKYFDRILIIRFSSLGDVVLTTPVLSNLKENFSNAEIGFVTKSAYGSLFENDPRVDQHFLLSASNGSIWQLAADIRRWSPTLERTTWGSTASATSTHSPTRSWSCRVSSTTRDGWS